MGFFKSIGRAIGRGVEKVGSFLGSEKIENTGRKIQNACSETSRKVGETSEFDKERANVSQTVKMNEILSSFSIGLQEQADSLEKGCVKEVQKYFMELIITLGKTKSNIGTERLKSSMREVERSTDGAIKKHLSKRVSLDDQECLKILEMDSGEKKVIAMRKFGEKVIDEALNNLALEISKIAKNQNEEIQEYLEDLLEKQKNEFEMMQNQFDKILMQSKEEVVDKENANVTPKILVEISDMVISRINELID